MVLFDPVAMHRRAATFDLPSPRIGGFTEPEPHSPKFFPLPAPSSSKLSSPRFTISQSFLSRQWLQRTTFLALFSLFSVSVYILLVNGSSNLHPAPVPQHINLPFQAAMKTIAHSNNDHPWRPTHKDVLASRPQIALTPEQELAALSSFIISLPDQNILPPSVDPSQPIDPQLILDFDTRADGAEVELKRLVTATWENYPVVMYTKPSAVTRGLRVLVDSFNLRPTPIVIDINERLDADTLEPVLRRVTGSPSFPILLVDGVLVDVSTGDRLQELGESGTLKKLIVEAGAIIDGGKRKKGRR